MLDIRELLERGRQIRDQEHAAAEALKKDELRVGSAGAVTADGEIYGTCHRIAHARLLGHDKPVEDSQKILFEAGEFNEERWVWRLAPAHKGTILRHKDCPVKHRIDGVEHDLTGRPDIVLGDENRVPLMGIENKGIYGTTAAISVFYDGVPKNENLIQAGTYAHYLGLPYALCYTLPSWVTLPYWAQKKFGDKHIKPFDRIFYVRWEDGLLQYRNELSQDWVRTVVTVDSIEDFYRLVVEMREKRDLGPRPTVGYVGGQEMKYGPCGLCEFAAACDKYDQTQDYDEWLNGISLICQS